MINGSAVKKKAPNTLQQAKGSKEKGRGKGDELHTKTMVEPPHASPEWHRYTQKGHIVLTIGFALLISTTLIRCGGTREDFCQLHA